MRQLANRGGSYFPQELEKGRIAGPFNSLPFKSFKTSIGLVPKKVEV